MIQVSLFYQLFFFKLQKIKAKWRIILQYKMILVARENGNGLKWCVCVHEVGEESLRPRA